MSDKEQLHVVVIGAGVVGLQNALTLLTDSKLDPTPKVTVIADVFPGSFAPHYASPWAGGQWRTHAHPSTASGMEQCDWDMQTYRYWKQLVMSEHPAGFDNGSQKIVHTNSGIGMLKSRYMWDQVTREIKPVQDGGELGEGLWWRNKVDDFRVLSDRERPSGTVYGVEWTSFCIDVPRYLQYLVEQLKAKGASLLEIKLPTDEGLLKALVAAEEVTGRVDWFVNATALGAKDLCNDDKMFPSRGQTVLVNGEATMARTRVGEGYIAYTIPRPGSGTTVLGGSNERGSWNEAIDEELHRKILERTKVLAPELVKADSMLDIVSRQVGFRPNREEGPRVEIEELAKAKIIHCYGHGGAGYQNSIGTSAKVAHLLQEFEAKQPSRL